MKRITGIFLCALLLFSLTAAAEPFNGDANMDKAQAAMGYVPTAPESALISPTGALLRVKEKAKAKKANGHTVVEFVLPPDSGNLQISTPGHSIIRWSSTPAILNPASAAAGRRARVERERAELTARLTMINARMALWQAIPKTANTEEMARMQESMATALPKLSLEQTELDRRLKLVNEELTRIPQSSNLGEKVRVVLADDIADGQSVNLDYSYTHDSCGWDPIYIFNARPNEGNGDHIDVRLLAEVWQFTGIDWPNTHITLSTQGSGPREPAPLPEWIVDSRRVYPQPRMLKAAGAPAAMMATANAASDEAAPVTADTSNIFATWQLAATGLPQGRARMQIASADWKAPLQWLARPTRDNGQVWLMATYALAPDQAWPVGQAEFNVDGQNAGNGIFRPRGGEAQLYFGVDPRVSIRTIENSRKRGESGFITANKTFTWSWTYVISNQREKPVTVKVERPAPQIVDAGVTVANNNKPEAKIDPEEHMYVWEVTAPAHGKANIEHSLTITSPTKLPLLPDMP